jgi:branched-chain amino acid transport system ATP-binding protein
MTLSVDNLHAAYDGIEVLHGVNLAVEKGEIIALLGANGAGKSTTIKAIMGLVKPTAGKILLDGRVLTGQDAHLTARAGISLVPEGRKIFKKMTVEENLQVGGAVRSAAEVREQLAEIYELFPRLAERRRQFGGTLSGGEQQMLAIGRALMSRPSFILMDEPSLGLAPLVVESVHQAIGRIRREMGIGGILVEQNVAVALSVAARAYVLMRGSVVLEGDTKSLASSQQLKDAYLGMTSGLAQSTSKTPDSYQ